jgi:hypothetical protein
MLRADLIRPRIKINNGQISTRPIPADYHYLAMAGDLVKLYQKQVGRSRGQLLEVLHDYEGDSLEYPVIRGLAAVLEGRCTFGHNPPLNPTQLRAALFQHGPVTRQPDLFNQTIREQVVSAVANQVGLSAQEVETTLFADLAEEQILLDTGEPFTPGQLIARYNLELARGLLYWAREARLFAQDSYKDIFKYIKLFKLMYTIQPAGDAPGYHITLYGPISPFVASTIRYGLQFAKFLPALLLCQSWRMEADIQLPQSPGQETLLYQLDHHTPLRGHFKASGLYDSQLEADFAAEFEAKYSGPRRKWKLTREDELIVVGDTVMIPDFSFTHHQDGRRALLEIVGYWHPNYLRRKLEKVRLAGRRDLILLVYQSANVSEGAFEEASAGEVLTFTRKPVLKDVLAAVERCAIDV